jgi:hypothetical protein
MGCRRQRQRDTAVLPPFQAQEQHMPRYFFHVVTKDGKLHADETGVELLDAEAVNREADRAADGLLRDVERSGRDYSGAIFEVQSEDGRQVFSRSICLKPDR